MKLDDEFMKNFRWITPVLVTVTGIMVTILIAVVNNLTTEIRAVRVEVKETREFAVQYTDKMIQLLLETKKSK